MRHVLQNKVSRRKENAGVLVGRNVKIRDRILRFLSGTPVKLTVLIPGDGVDEVGIVEVDDGNKPCTENQ